MIVQICFTGDSFLIETITTWILKQLIWTFNERTDNDEIMRMFIFLHRLGAYAI